MLARLTVPFADARAGELTWALAPAEALPLAAMSVAVGGGALRLVILGASHQVEARLPGATACVESVTCGGPGPPLLPDAAARDIGGLRYRFTSFVERLDEDGFTSRVGRLRQSLVPDPSALVACFPGSPHALTGMVAFTDGRGVAWRTWHAYPVTGELVHTSTRLAWG